MLVRCVLRPRLEKDHPASGAGAARPIGNVRRRTLPPPGVAVCVGLAACLSALLGCRQLGHATDREVAAAIAARQAEVLNYSRPVPLGDADEPLPTPGRQAYAYTPSPITTEVPEGFEPLPKSESRPATMPSTAPATMPSAAPATMPSTAPSTMPSTAPATAPSTAPTAIGPEGELELPRYRDKVFTLTDALAYAQQHRREYQTAKEDLYLVTLALTLERHLWTPIFAADLRTVYGNYGEITNFDQAMRFVADLSVSQRLPYGGEFTAAMISTLIRDVENNITASEGSQIQLGLNVPFLRSAGHVAREDLVQLERDLTYAVRDFERFRRRQLVQVAQTYFDLLRAKQNVIDSAQSLDRFREDFERARALEEAGTGTMLDTREAEQQMLSGENTLEDRREAFRSQTDTFKLLIGMPVSEPMGLDDLEDIDTIEQQVEAGRYPLLQSSPAMGDEERTTQAAIQYRLDLLNRRDQIDDAKRGVAVARNGLLPDLDWNSTLSFDTDPEHYKLGAFEVARANWRSELILSLPLERTRERNRYRASLIDVRRARRAYEDQLERIRSDVRSAVNRIGLEETSLEIQHRNLQVSDLRREYARLQFYEGDIRAQDLFRAEDDWTAARNRLNLAKTSRWAALLDFRLATGTLRVGEDGTQQPRETP
ncbi:MAG TPA: TolC family protein [Thermoguttaceae bacterium]|nr:TolC family protein [Thermoguttaceae bacterium]